MVLDSTGREEALMADHGAAITLPAAGTYRIDPTRSLVHYSGRHLFGLGTVRATFAVRDGALRVGDPVTTSSVTVTVDAASFTSGNPRRDKDVRASGLLDVATYPDITFASESVRASEDGLVVAGLVTAHGTPVPVELQVDRLTPEDTGVRVHARVARLDRTAFGVTGKKGMVGRDLDLELDVVALPEQ